MTERFLERLTWQEVEAAIERGIDAVLIPIGTTEQHGPHMPLDTDCFIARSLCARAAAAGEADGVELLVAPTLNVTLSWYHMQFPGSIRLSTTTFLQVFREICDSLVHHGFGNLVAVNGHGGNAAIARVAATEESTVQWTKKPTRYAMNQPGRGCPGSGKWGSANVQTIIATVISPSALSNLEVALLKTVVNRCSR